MPPRKRFYKKKKPTFKRWKRKMAKKRTTALIKRVVGRMAERKDTQYTSPIQYLANALNTTDFGANTIELTQSSTGAALNIAQGTGQANRIGNRIRVVSAKLRLILFPHGYDELVNSTPLPQNVRVVIYKLKGQDTSKTQAQAVFSAGGNCFQANNTTAPMTGLITDMNSEINTDIITVYSNRVYKLGASSYDYTSSPSGGVFFGNNNDYKYNVIRRYNLFKCGFPKVFDYNDTQTFPYGYRPLFITFMPCNADGSAPAGSTYSRPIKIQYQISLQFTDM